MQILLVDAANVAVVFIIIVDVFIFIVVILIDALKTCELVIFIFSKEVSGGLSFER